MNSRYNFFTMISVVWVCQNRRRIFQAGKGKKTATLYLAGLCKDDINGLTPNICQKSIVDVFL